MGVGEGHRGLSSNMPPARVTCMRITYCILISCLVTHCVAPATDRIVHHMQQ